jgi:hypothetical protein
MAYPTAYLSDELAPFSEQIGNIWRSLTPARRRKPWWSVSFKAEVSGEVAQLALLAPSLIAEVAPLVLFWHSHLAVWQMSGIMAASFAFTWWLTWAVVAAIKSWQS